MSDSPPGLYPRLWQLVPRELGFLLLGVPTAVVGFAVTIPLFALGIGTLITFFIGLVSLIAALYVSRWFGTVELVRLEWAGRPAIVRPEWRPVRAAPGFLGWVKRMLGNGHYWLYLLHTTIVNFVVSLVTWVVALVWVVVGLGGISYWFWGRFPANDTDGWYLSRSIFWFFGIPSDGVDFEAWDSVCYFIAGIILLATLPFITHALTLVHQGIAAGMLGAFRSDALKHEVASLNESRGAAIAAEGHSLRRLERDIHDGPQQRLVRMQMDLSAADRQVEVDPGKARALIAEAMEQSRDALDELRALSRGFAPPILMDRGLVAALESAAMRSTVPARVVNQLPAGVELEQDVERNAYFVASEAMANAAKHADAAEVEVRVGVLAKGLDGNSLLEVVVTDNGRGGATELSGHGLAGLAERLRGLGGTLDIQSPQGGPTVVGARLPLTASVSSP
ncbi:sensor histidine kinase [Microbacterium murale]|uniref:sensor histidine kinase n=1 Tax=Microbacterium murale TaxID=1081040 RepID=UPI0027D7B59F|nr:sensor histidine kinase [Microbacterium murale]